MSNLESLLHIERDQLSPDMDIQAVIDRLDLAEVSLRYAIEWRLCQTFTFTQDGKIVAQGEGPTVRDAFFSAVENMKWRRLLYVILHEDADPHGPSEGDVRGLVALASDASRRGDVELKALARKGLRDIADKAKGAIIRDLCEHHLESFAA